jgi:hypothetical protein
VFDVPPLYTQAAETASVSGTVIFFTISRQGFEVYEAMAIQTPFPGQWRGITWYKFGHFFLEGPEQNISYKHLRISKKAIRHHILYQHNSLNTHF